MTKKHEDVKFRTLTVSSEIYDLLAQLRKAEEKELGLELSWNNFLSILCKRLAETAEKNGRSSR